MTNLRTAAAILLAATLTLSGCKTTQRTTTGTVVKTQYSPTPAPVANAGKITGTIHFNGKPPARVKIDMSMDPTCSMLAPENDAEQYIVSAGGKLANVYVYIKSGAPASKAPANTPPIVLDQKGCRYTPHVFALQQGGSVEFRNSDPTMHNIHTTPADGSASMDVSQGPMGAAQTRQFSQPETMLPVRCNNHPWMNAFINVSATPFFAVSATDGSFTINGLPPGNYTLAAVHEKLGEQEIQVTVPPNATAKADFTYAMK